MRTVDIIRRKRDGHALSREAIDTFVRGVADGSWPDYASAALLMAIVIRGMDPDETRWLTEAMVASGERVDLSDLPAPTVGKHSTGGVGDKVSIVLAPVVAACGVIVPKMSGRGLGHTGGTLDKLEAIPGFRVALGLDEFRALLARVGCAMISQTATIAPADKTLYALRDVTATVESVPLISASIMSKKLAEGSQSLVLDVKCGAGAFMKTPDQARVLARSLVAIGASAGVRTEACITRMDRPLGRAVGNALEIVECLETLKGRGPADLTGLVVHLASRMLELGGRATSGAEGERLAREAIASGAALDRFRRMVDGQGGDPRVVDDYARLPTAAGRHVLTAPASGVIAHIDAEAIGRASMHLGAGRERVGDRIDPAAGILLRLEPGDEVRAGDAVFELHFTDAARLPEAAEIAKSALSISPLAPASRPLVIEWVRAGAA
ncbi:MAG: thymidine phosphorylase [Vicinamibacterales bacterium]